MRNIKKILYKIKHKVIKIFSNKIYRPFVKKMYKIYARIMDWRIGRISVDKLKQSKYENLGAKATESTNYTWPKMIFSCFPLKKDDVFIDVGCGEGRVLTYLYLKKHRNKMIGIELDEEIAQIAKNRTKKCKNIKIVQGNVLEQSELFKDATAVYLFNPFEEDVLLAFVEMIEKTVDHQLIMYYSNDLHRKVLDKRENWYILRRNIIDIISTPKRNYTIYGYRPDDKK